jgi:hypothetical protein
MRFSYRMVPEVYQHRLNTQPLPSRQNPRQLGRRRILRAMLGNHPHHPLTYRGLNLLRHLHILLNSVLGGDGAVSSSPMPLSRPARIASRVLAYLVAAGVVVQAASISYGMFGLTKWIEGGGTLDESTELTPGLGGYTGFSWHATGGIFILLAISLLF